MTGIQCLVQIWLSYDYQTGQYAPAGGSEAQQAQQQQQGSHYQQGQHQQQSYQQQPQQAAQPAQPLTDSRSSYEIPSASNGAQPAAHPGEHTDNAS